MWVTCKICWTWCQGCGRKCKCWRGANMIGSANSMYDLWMPVDMIKKNIVDIYNLKRRHTPVEIFDYYVNGIDLPEKNIRNNSWEVVSQSYIHTVANFQPTPNPQPKCCYVKEGEKKTVTVWSRCIYCNNVKMYAPDVCPSYWLEVKEEDKKEQSKENTVEENNEANLDSNQE